MNAVKRILLVDDSRDELQAIDQMLTGAQEDWKVECAESGAAALQKMFLHPFDVVVTDFHMPKMTGEELLHKVMLQYPGTVRIVLSGFFDAKVTDRLLQTAHQYLCKPCTTTELREAISRALFLRDLLANERLKQFVSQIPALPNVPGVYTELMLELQCSAPSLDEITHVIARDMSLSTKLLQLANSRLFGIAQRIIDIEQAVTELGVERVKTLVLALQTFGVFERLKKDERSLKPLWHHCWAVGRLAHRISEAENFESYGTHQSLTAGLLHDVGKLIFLTGVPHEFGKAIQLHRQKELALWRAEQETFGCTHAEVGAYLLAVWGLPIPVVETVALHHTPSISSTRSLSVITAVHVADALEREASASTDFPMAKLDREYLDRLGLIGRVEVWRELRSDLLAEKADHR